jgi:hypothetical protein
MESGSLGLVAFWSDISPSYIERYREWHNTEHIPERVGIPGFNAGHRYVRVHDAGRNFFMYYDVASPEVLKSADYLDALDKPTPWTSEALQYFRNPLRNLYRKMEEKGIEPKSASKFLLCARFDCAEDVTTAVCATMLTRLATDGAYRVRLFELDAAATQIKTREREIYGTQLEAQRYLVLVEKSAEDNRALLEASAAQLGDAGSENLEIELYRLEFGLRASPQKDA